MKTTFRYLAAAFTVIAAVSCAKHEELGPQVEAPVGTYQYLLNVSHENDGTKTSLGEDGLSILWSKEDQIGIACSDGKTYSEVEEAGGAQSIADAETYEPSTSASFAITLNEGYKPLAAVYPYFATAKAAGGSNSGFEGLACSAYIPEEQTGIKDNIPANAFAMIGKINSDNTCQMLNVGAVIKFEITTEHITSLRFEGNNSEILSGARYYHTETGEWVKETEASGKTSVTLVPSGVVFEKGVYYFVVGPNTLTDGFTITLTTVKGQTVSKSTTSPFKIERNKKYTGFGSDEGWFSEIMTGAASNLGTAEGTTATLYGIVRSAMTNVASYGFQTSTDGENWTDYNGTITDRFFTEPSTPLNTFTAELSGLTPEQTYYYRAVCTKANGLTTYGKTNSFKTYANAQSAVINLHNGWDPEYWPFTNIQRNNPSQTTEDFGINKGTGSAALWKNKPLTLQIANDLQFEVKATGGAWLNNANGSLTLKVQEGDYIKFPTIEGKKPVSVILVAGGIAKDYLEKSYKTGSDNTMGVPSIQKLVGEEIETVAGGTKWAPKPSHIYNIHTWELNGTDSGQYEMCFNSSSSLNCYISYLEVVYADAESKPASIDQNLLFTVDGTNKYWPFNGGVAQTDPTKSPCPKYGTYVTENGLQGPFYTPEHPEIKYTFKIKEKAGDDYWRITAQGLRFGGSVGDYMAFPALEDYKLTYVKIRSGKSTTSYSISNASGDYTSGLKTSQGNDTYIEFNLTETTADTEYRLIVCHSDSDSVKHAAIREMWITYELVK